jgi:hypothetical protein
MYNLSHSLQSRVDPSSYIKTCLEKSPSVFSLHSELVTLVLNQAPDTKKLVAKKKKRRAKKDCNEVPEQLDTDMVDIASEDGDSDWDENNRFAILRN